MGSVANLAIAIAQVCRCGMSESHGTRTGGSGGSMRMYASSEAPSRGWFSGAPYSGHQSSSHANPSEPVTMNAQFQPYWSVIHGTIATDTSTPTLVPELKIPVASARSRFGNHSATVLIAAGKLAASPSQHSNVWMKDGSHAIAVSLYRVHAGTGLGVP